MSQEPRSVAVQLETSLMSSAVIAYKSEGSGHVEISGNGNSYQQTFSRLPHRTPMDMQFENIGFTASLGCRKGTVF